MSFKISVIIATFNSGRTLRQTLDSIRYQTYKNVETIIIDGLSSDNTLEIINEYSDVVTKCISEKDSGIYEAFNKGINLATGDYIGFIGSDDCYIDYSVFDNIIKDLSVDIDMISYPIVCIDEYYKNEYIFFNTLDKEDILTGKMLPHPGLFVKTKIMKKYMFNDKNKIISDYEFLLRYLMDDRAVLNIGNMIWSGSEPIFNINRYFRIIFFRSRFCGYRNFFDNKFYNGSFGFE